MKIKEINYGLTVNTGNFETTRFDITATVDPDEDWQQVFIRLKKLSHKIKQHIIEEAKIQSHP